MGWISDFLGGGAKAPKRPKILGEAADWSADFARELAEMYDGLRPMLDKFVSDYPQFADRIDSLYEQVGGELGERLGKDIKWQKYGDKLQGDALREVSQWGSQGRQDEAAEGARRAYGRQLGAVEEARERRLSRRGGHDGSLASDLATARGYAGVSDDARRGERDRGRQAWVDFLPVAKQYSEAPLARYNQIEGLENKKIANAASRYEVPGEAYNWYAGAKDNVANAYNSASNAALNDYNLRVKNKMHNAQRRNNIIRTGIQTAIGFATGGPVGAGLAGGQSAASTPGLNYNPYYGGQNPYGGQGQHGPGPYGGSSGPSLWDRFKSAGEYLSGSYQPLNYYRENEG